VNDEPLEGAEDDSEDTLAPGDVWGWTVWQDMGEGGLDEAVQHFVEEDKDMGEWDEDDDWGIESDDEVGLDHSIQRTDVHTLMEESAVGVFMCVLTALGERACTTAFDLI